jgi:iron donor protein CyaY
MKGLRGTDEKVKNTEESAQNPKEKRTNFYNSCPLSAPCYTWEMQDELEFRRAAEKALEQLKKHLIAREEEDEAGFEVEEQNGVLNVAFEEPPAKFVITPNTPVRQIWISALSTSFKLDWDDKAGTFVLPRTGESLEPLVDRLIQQNGQEKTAG